MFIREIRHIDTDKVRAMCIRNNYYTCGANEDYDKMFQMCKLNFGILTIAQDILNHSNKAKLMEECGCDKLELLENICFELANNCSWVEISLED